LIAKKSSRVGIEMDIENIEKSCDVLAKSGTEHAHQRAFFAWLAWMKRENIYPRSDRMFAIPNGGLRDKITAARLKAEGVKAGVPDTFYPVQRYYDGGMARYAGLWIEFKKASGKEQVNQSEWIYTACGDGYAACTCYSWRGAAQAFADYNSGKAIVREYM
jgi:ABC-type amino acid transport substrate-binding protein